MTTSTLTLAVFLLARIEDDEEVARQATHRGGWCNDGITAAHIITRQDDVLGEMRTTADTVHIARHDPVRVLAECEAKRAIVREYQEVRGCAGGEQRSIGEWQALERAMEFLAQPYASHSDFRDEWRA